MEGHTVAVPDEIIRVILSQAVVSTNSDLESFSKRGSNNDIDTERGSVGNSGMVTEILPAFEDEGRRLRQNNDINKYHYTSGSGNSITNNQKSADSADHLRGRTQLEEASLLESLASVSRDQGVSDQLTLERFQVLRAPQGGRLKLESTPLKKLDSFSRAQLERGELLVS